MVLLFLGGNMINEYNYEVLSREELERNFKLMKDNNIEVRETIILHNIKLVFYRYYKRFSNTNMNMEDIVAYGMIGLIKAVDTFRLDKKCTFTTYASKCTVSYTHLTLPTICSV